MLLSILFFSAAVAGPGTEPLAVVRSFHEALASGDRSRALALLDPTVVIFEQGGAEMSRDEYTSEHLDADIEFSRATNSKMVDQRTQAREKSAWVLTISETSGNFRGKDVASRNVETMVLAKTASGWHIVHIHWSSHSQRKP
jgi:ketosteroid isomerase-like protein